MTSSHRVPPFPSWNSWLTLLSRIPHRHIWELIEGYGEKGNNLKWKMERRLLRNCIATCECNSQSNTFLLSVQCDNTVFWKSARGYFWMQWSLRWQRKYPQTKTRKKPCLKLLGDVWIHLTELPLCFLKQSINTLFEEPEKGYFPSHFSLADKGNIISSKRERSFLRNFFVICAFISESYKLVLRKQFASSLFVEYAMWYFGAH